MLSQIRNLAIVMALFMSAAVAQLYEITIFPWGGGGTTSIVYEPAFDVSVNAFGTIKFWILDDDGWPVEIVWHWEDHYAQWMIIRQVG